MKRRLCFEDFAIHCMHPMELVTSPSHASTRENTTSHVSTSSSTPVPQLGVSPPSANVALPHSRSPGITKILSNDSTFLTAQDSVSLPETGRPRAYTYSHKKEVLEKIARKGLCAHDAFSQYIRLLPIMVNLVLLMILMISALQPCKMMFA